MSEKKVLRIHLLVQDESGPIASAPGGTTFTVGTHSRWVVACDHAIVMGPWDRGTSEPWAVHCKACKATDAFQKIDRPRPGQAPGDLPDQVET